MRRRKRVSGSLLTLIGACLAVIGAGISAVGAFRASDESRKRSDLLAAKSDEIARLNREVADLSKTVAEYVTGANSFFYLHVFHFGEANFQPRIVHVGKNPVRDTEVLLYDISEQVPALTSGQTHVDLDREPDYRNKADASYPGHPNKLLGKTFETNPTRDSYAYFVYFNGGSGAYRQVFEFVKIKGTWKQAYRVERVPFDEMRVPVGEYFEEGFPNNRKLLLRPTPGYKRLDAPQEKRPAIPR
jgi:hypothetical protein